MKRKKTLFILFSFFLFSIGLAFFLNICIASSHFTKLEHSLRIDPFLFSLSLVAVFFLLIFGWIFLARIETNFFAGDKVTALWQGFLASTPLFFFLLSPFLLQHYLTRDDFRTRLSVLAVLIFLAIIYLKLIEWNKIFNTSFSFFKKWEAKLSALSLRKKLVILFFLAFIIYNISTFVIVSKGITFSGDEPNYLLTTHSLLKDKDINLANNYAQKDYFSFYSREENPRLKLGIYGRYGRKGKGYIYPINLPGISVLMLPFYWLSQFFKGKALTFILKGSLSIWAALVGLQLYLFSKERWQKEKISLALWFLYSFSSPVLFYAIHLYPEIPVALFSFFIYRKISSKSPLSLFHYLFLGFLLSTFFWFGLKYNFIFWTLLLVSLYFLLKYHRARSKIFIFLAFPLLSFFLFYYFVYNLYGTFSPFSIYEGVMTPEQMQAFKEGVLGLPLLSRIETFLDYFIDQKDGLLLYSPFYLFTFLGLVEIFRRAKREFFILLFISLPYLLNYAFFTHRQGYCPQARILTPISWIGAIAIGYFIVYNQKRLYSFLFWFFSLASLAVTSLLLLNPKFLYQPTTHEFTSRAGELFVYLSNLHFFLPPLLPSFIKIKNVGYLPNYFWILAIAIFVSAYILLKGKMALKHGSHFCFAFFLLAGCLYLRVLYPQSVPYPIQTVYYSPQKAMGFYLFPMGEGVVIKQTGELYLHRQKSYKILFSSRTKLEKIKLTFGSENGEYEVKMTFFDFVLFEGKTSYERKELVLTPETHYPLKALFLYEINLSLKKRSSESMLIEPYYFFVTPLKD